MNDRCEDMKDGNIATGKMHVDEIRAINRYVMEKFKHKCPNFLSWILMLHRFGKNPVDAMMLWRASGDTGEIYKARFFTDRFEYIITARPDTKTEIVEEYDAGYLGAIVLNRKSRAGEDWARGTDLTDGPYDEGIWICIMADIIGHEMVRLGT